MPPITRDRYGDFLYGEGFYGVDIQPTGPKVVTNLFVIREPFYNIIHWDAPEYNVDGSHALQLDIQSFVRIKLIFKA